jgi:hypothetical protein
MLVLKESALLALAGTNRGVIQELLDLKKKDKKDIIKWGRPILCLRQMAKSVK